MSEVEWNADDEPAPKKKKAIPTWVWVGCGGGCLLVLLAVGALGAFTWFVADSFSDPEKAWPALSEHMAYDERPEGWNIVGGEIGGQGDYTLTPNGDVEVIEGGGNLILKVQVFPTRQGLEDLMDPDSTINTGVLAGIGKLENAEEGVIEVQGREVRCLRYTGMGVPDWMVESEEVQSAASVRLDITGESKRFAALTVTRAAADSLSDEDVEALLAPFDVWRGK